MEYEESGERPFQNVHYAITDEEARRFLEQLADDESELRQRLSTENAREVLLEYKIDIVGIPERVKLPPANEIRTFISNHLQRPDESDNVGYAILYFMLGGAMPIVVADGDAA
jgi:hypothetical protein